MEQAVPTATIPSEDTTAVTPAPEPTDGLQDEAFCLPVKFNKQDYQLTLEEATAYAQKGMKFDTVEPLLTRLKTLAQANGLGVRELVDALCDGGDSRTAEERMAEEFLALRAECPDVATFEALPESVVRTALDEGMSLLDAYLRYHYRERAKIDAARAAAEHASAASAGPQRDAVHTVDSVTAAMLNGVWR